MQVIYLTKFNGFILKFADIDECVPAPCKNGATCVDLVGGYRCDCVPGYTGSNCETGDLQGGHKMLRRTSKHF